MGLPFGPPLPPMLGRLARELPRGDYVYEPKWDGFRCIVFRDREDVDLRSRHDRPLARYFPEVVHGLLRLRSDAFVLDGELVVHSGDRFDFAALMARLHPSASRVTQLMHETPARFVAFDLLARGAEDMRARPFAERRAALAGVLHTAEDPIRLTPATDDPAVAEQWLDRFQGSGLDGVMAKPRHDPYRPGARTMVKVKPERTIECVLAGFRLLVGEPLVASLLLGLYDDDQTLVHIGVVTSFTKRRRQELFAELRPLAVPLEDHPWEHGYLLGGGHMGRLPGAAGRWDPDEMELDWVPLAPERVLEVAVDQVDAGRLRHPARFKRWRPDRDPRSCTLDQLAVRTPVAFPQIR